MPRGPRLDAPDALHHVMVGGIECCIIFRDDVNVLADTTPQPTQPRWR
jgi:hypothetical protein